MRAAVVCTTIHDCDFLPALCRNLRRYGREHQTTIWIIPDRQTPPAAAARAAEWRAQGFDVRFVALEQQEDFLRPFPELAQRIPYNSDNRRNVGFLQALAQGAELLISIDDDNYPHPASDFVGEHFIAGEITDRVVATDTYPIYPRGFPDRVRNGEQTAVSSRDEALPVGMNVGLWLGDPDVDAITRNYHAFNVTGWCEKVCHVGPGTWTPINTQNTALLAELIPAYYYVPMNENIDGLRIDRFGDILSGLFCKKVCDRLGYAVRIGGPICEHRRTPHNLLRDLHQELAGIALLEELTAWLEQVELTGHDAEDTYVGLADALDEALPHFAGYLWDDAARSFFRKVTAAMRVWINATRTIVHGCAPAPVAG